MADIRPSIDAALSAFGVPATVTDPDGATVELEVFWLPETTIESQSGDVRVAERRRVLALPRAECGGLVVRGSIVEAAGFDGADTSLWRVDSVDSSFYDHLRAVVTPYEAV
jgi:hypothetical protein